MKVSQSSDSFESESDVKTGWCRCAVYAVHQTWSNDCFRGRRAIRWEWVGLPLPWLQTSWEEIPKRRRYATKS
jgi:hypothetical protein